MRPITPLQPNIIRYLVEQNKWTELTNHIMDLQSRVGLLEVIVADQEWRPIETAPKGCDIWVLAYFETEHGEKMVDCVCQWEDGTWTTTWDLKVEPTHWMPLPKHPTGF